MNVIPNLRTSFFKQFPITLCQVACHSKNKAPSLWRSSGSLAQEWESANSCDRGTSPTEARSCPDPQ